MTTAEAKTVFLVDDDSSTVDLYSNRLEQAGFKTATAFDAAQATEALANIRADLIILDLMLPNRGGIELLEAIRADSRHKETPVLLLSNAYLPEMTQRAMRAGGNKALPRSECTSSELISVSRALVGVPRQQDSSTPAEESAAASLAEQLKRDLFDEGGSEAAAIQ